MSNINFTKIHGIGNDYIFIDAINQNIKTPGKLSQKMSDRHFGVGADGIILILESSKADFKMRMFNSDGSESEMCGNGIRGFAKYVYDNGLTDKKQIKIETGAGIKELNLKTVKGKVNLVTVDMGEPILERTRIPMNGDPGTVINEQLDLDDGVTFEITAVSMGNPHAVIFVEDCDNFPVEKYGPLIENHYSFPNRTNVEFVQITSENTAKQRTWERGAGETLACGTGACSVTVAGFLTKQLSKKSTISLRGGNLQINWDEKTNHVFMTGPAEEAFKGTWEI